jgi:hypothetical protein
MPDWFYRTVGRPFLLRLPDGLARKIALGSVGVLGRSSVGLGNNVILGHMRAPAALAVHRCGLTFRSPVGLGRRLDPEALALGALERFGVGFLEAGPVAMTERGSPMARPEVGDDGSLLCRPSDFVADLAWWKRALSKRALREVPLLVRLAPADNAELPALVEGLRDLADLFVIEPAGNDVPPPCGKRGWLLAIDDDVPDVAERIARARDLGYAGIVLDFEARRMDGWRRIGLGGEAGMFERCLERVRNARAMLPPDALLLVAQAIRQPRDAREIFEAGADLVQVDNAVVHAGPGMPKRINDALLTLRPVASQPSNGVEGKPPVRWAWFWICVLGAAMVLGGLIALGIVATRVLLPYDEHYLGLSREMLRLASPRILEFMAHDRVTLAGTMLGLGVFYIALGWHAVRRGAHWAQLSVVASAVTGFASFFFFLGFGYFDPFHAFVSAVLFQFTLLALVLPRGAATAERLPAEWNEDGAWRRAQWGQLCLVLHAVGLLGAGAVISAIGMGRVFVAEDITFLSLARDQLETIGARLIPVVAHDRASLGGMLLANGVALLLTTFWGFRRGRAWLWWTIFGVGAPAYACALGVHFFVGYTDWHHLVPALVGLALWIAGLALSRGWLASKS